MLLAGFALVYGANWLLVPLEVPVGALVRITRLDVRDTFGRTTTVGPTAPGGEWGMFGVSRADGPPDGALLIAPALAASLQGRDIEEVLLLRDEAANLAWAVERAVEGEHGLPADRAQAAHEGVPPAPPPARPPDTLPYRLRTDPPPHWFPLLPQRAQPTDPSMTFRLGALPRVTPGGPATPLRPRGRLLAPMVEGPPGHAARGRGPARGRARHARLPARALDRRHHLPLARPAQDGRPRRGLERPALRHHRTRLSPLAGRPPDGVRPAYFAVRNGCRTAQSCAGWLPRGSAIATRGWLPLGHHLVAVMLLSRARRASLCNGLIGGEGVLRTNFLISLRAPSQNRGASPESASPRRSSASRHARRSRDGCAPRSHGGRPRRT